jgi:hypothetical protein
MRLNARKVRQATLKLRCRYVSHRTKNTDKAHYLSPMAASKQMHVAIAKQGV